MIVDMISANGFDGPPIPQRIFWLAMKGLLAIALLNAGRNLPDSEGSLRALQSLYQDQPDCFVPLQDGVFVQLGNHRHVCFDQISSCGPQGFSDFLSVLSLVCFFVFRVVTVCDHPPNAYAFGSSQKQNSAQKHHCHHHCSAWFMRWQSRWMPLNPLRPLRVVSSLSQGL